MNETSTCFLANVAGQIVSSTLVLAAAAFLSKKWVKSLFDASHTRLEASLKRDVYQFTKLHDRRAEIVEELHSLLVEFTRSAADFLDMRASPDDQSYQQKKTKLDEEYSALNLFFQKNKIFFLSSTNQEVEKLLKFLFKHPQNHDTFLEFREQGLLNDPQILKEWQDNSSEFYENTRKALEAVQKEFRTLLGFKQSDAE